MIDIKDFLTFEVAEHYSKEIEESWGKDWNDIDFKVRLMRQDFMFVKDVWDTYKMPKGMVKEETLVGVLQKRFSNIHACRVCRPLGDFKDFDNASHMEVYDGLVARMLEERMDARGNMVSFVEALLPHTELMAEKYGYGKYSDYFKKNKAKFALGLSIMFYRSAIGIYLESYVNNHLTAMFENHNEFVYRVAPSDMEFKDVDGILYRRDNDEVVANISIKTLKAFTEGSIFGNWRKPVAEGGKGKTLPDIYVGITNDEYGDGTKDIMKVRTIKVDGLSLKDLCLISRNEVEAAV